MLSEGGSEDVAVTYYLVLYLSVQCSKWSFPIRQLISQVDISCRGRKNMP